MVPLPLPGVQAEAPSLPGDERQKGRVLQATHPRLDSGSGEGLDVRATLGKPVCSLPLGHRTEEHVRATLVFSLKPVFVFVVTLAPGVRAVIVRG